MDVSVTIGPDTDERNVSLIISDENGFNPDCFDMLVSRAVTHACWLWRELHAEATT